MPGAVAQAWGSLWVPGQPRLYNEFPAKALPEGKLEQHPFQATRRAKGNSWKDLRIDFAHTTSVSMTKYGARERTQH